MKLIAAQISSAAGNIEKNLGKHVDIIHQAANLSADGIFFPELSLSGYEPSLAQVVAIEPTDERLDVLQTWSDHYSMFIAVGVPTKGKKGTEISMIAFQPGVARTTYSKQHLHADELPFFTSGSEQKLFTCVDVLLAPAICYESLQAIHALQAAEAGAEVYFTSVAKSERGVAAAYRHYPLVAK
jgi:predicted amidohydrolase